MKNCGFRVKAEMTACNWQGNFRETFTCGTSIPYKMNGLLFPHSTEIKALCFDLCLVNGRLSAL